MIILVLIYLKSKSNKVVIFLRYTYKIKFEF